MTAKPALLCTILSSAYQQSLVSVGSPPCSLRLQGNICLQMGKVRSLDELDEVGEADESAAGIKLMDEVSSPASLVYCLWILMG